MTSTQDYNAGYPVLMLGSTGSDVSDLQARLLELGYYEGAIDYTVEALGTLRLYHTESERLPLELSKKEHKALEAFGK